MHDFDNGKDSSSDGKCVVGEWNNFRQKVIPCNREWYSVVHPPDQFRHWCSILEAGGDCMHLEDL